MNKVAKIFLITFLTLAIFGSIFKIDENILYAQSITFQKVYGTGQQEEIGESVVQTDDNGYIVVGGGYKCLRTDRYGDTLWTGRVPSSGSCIQKTFDNNFVYTSSQYSLVKFDIKGNVIWLRNQYNPSSFTGYISETSDHGFILSGVVVGAATLYPYILRTDSLGYRTWEKVYNSYHDRTATRIVQTNDRGFIFTGTDTGAYIMKIDSLGNFLWYKNYKANMLNGISILELANGYIVCGNVNLLRVDNFGNILWSKSYSLGIEPNTFFLSIIKTIDGGYALTGGRDTSLSMDFVPLTLLLKTDSSGNQLWYKLFGVDNSNLDYNAGHDIRQTSDSGFIITGIIDTNHSFKDNSKNNVFGGDLILIKSDKNGNNPTFIQNNNSNADINFKLYQNYPNPFNPTTKINFTIPKEGKVTLKIYDILGKEVKTLVNEFRNAGSYQVIFNGINLSSGVYYYKIESGDFTQVRKMVLLK